MSSNFPSTLTSYTDPLATNKLNSPSHSGIETNQNSGLRQIEDVIGLAGNASTIGTIQYDLRSPASNGGGHVQTPNKGGTGQTAFAKGDLLVGQSSSVLAKLASGTDGQTPLADSTQATGIKWGTPPGDLFSSSVWQINGILDGSIMTPGSSGTGANIGSVVGELRLNAGSGNPSFANASFPTTVLKADFSKNISLRVQGLVSQNSNNPFWTKFGTGNLGTQATASVISSYLGFISTGSILYAAVSNGSIQGIQNISNNGINIASVHTYDIIFITGVSAKFYVDNVLQATFVTGLPSMNTTKIFEATAIDANGSNNSASYFNGFAYKQSF